jgi:hypothetical protein
VGEETGVKHRESAVGTEETGTDRDTETDRVDWSQMEWDEQSEIEKVNRGSVQVGVMKW